MLRVTVELLPNGDETKPRHMGTATIALTGVRADARIGDYDVMLSKWGRPKEAWRRGHVTDFQRKDFGPWDLLLAGLLACIEGRTERMCEVAERLATAEQQKLLDSLHPRVLKLAKAGKPFIVIGGHEPYYLDAYRMVREQEQKQGSWTEDCEAAFQEALAARGG